jgi:hypothetical protein
VILIAHILPNSVSGFWWAMSNASCSTWGDPYPTAGASLSLWEKTALAPLQIDRVFQKSNPADHKRMYK